MGGGGSVGGTRPRENNFVIDGVDDNNLAVTGPNSTVIPDAVAEFALQTNQFSAEYGHSSGGQFVLVTKTGTNNWHGSGEWYNQNKNYNSNPINSPIVDDRKVIAESGFLADETYPVALQRLARSPETAFRDIPLTTHSRYCCRNPDRTKSRRFPVARPT